MYSYGSATREPGMNVIYEPQPQMDFSTHILYDDPPAPNPRRVRIFLAEKGVDIPKAGVSVMKGEHRTPDFVAKNPLHQIPLLELPDGSFIAETVAICRYVEACVPSPDLMGATPAEIGTVEMWQRRVELTLFQQIGHVWRHVAKLTRRLPGRNEAWGQENAERVQSSLRWFDGELAKRPFVAGDRFTLPDITMLCAVDFARTLVGIEVPETLTHLWRWHGVVSARPSASA